jgi:tRNA (5-methylaminomethyl-2-thiouridylate)-methyltransferase
MRIAVLLSGGVDSSVALALLKQQGHDITAFYIKIWLQDELAFLGNCPWDEDISYARAVCQQLNVPLEIVPLQKEYHDIVVAYTIQQIKAGRTPNPDMICNERIKFDAFIRAIDSSYEYIASGHYAQIEHNADSSVLLCSPDPVKDQTYFLAQMKVAQLRRVLFPIGHLTKPQVRQYAQQFNLPNQQRPDSQGLCFLGKLKFSDFIRHYIPDETGSIIEYESGKWLGEHRGFWHHTIGQRQGLGLPGGPWYVVSKEVATNTVFVSRDYYAPDKKRDTLTISACNWLVDTIEGYSSLEVKLRHGVRRYQCTVVQEQNDIRVNLDASDQGIAAGQFAVLYDGMRCLGSGVINGSYR